MDWPESTEPVLTVAPRGYQRHGGKVGPLDVIKENPLEWKSRYGSMTVSVYGVGTVDGLNEKGLGAHALYLKSTGLPERDPARPPCRLPCGPSTCWITRRPSMRRSP